ncbi:hypothetical protein BGW38_010996 [Lunasporangiospora selenospora]|uniref:Uncharacterized protein n=1 Tax=Lunasporangiospora selenospora TaxID=979761 RepID=A0A9P6KF47_9FUNG|nr:hypothetical protein BGW38_010996 [Lunasporangiospora selenospora]
MALDLAYFFDLKTLFDKSHGRIVDFRRFMKEVVGVPVDSALVDSEFGAQIAYWSERISQQDSPTPGSIQDFRATAFTDNESDEYLDENEVNGGSDQHPIQLTRIHRDTWNADFSEELSTVDNAIRNGLIDDFATHPPIDAHIQQLVRKTFYAFSDVRGGGMDRIVEWSLNFSYTPNIGDQGQPSYVLTPLLDQDSCQPPADDPSVEFIPWEARFPSFATCRIDHYVGIKQQLEPIQSRILSIDGQFHTTGWIPIAYSSLENAQRYRDIASSYLQSAPVVDRAIDHLFRNLHNMIVGVNDNDIKINGDPAPWLKLSMHVRRGDFLTSGMGWQDFHDSWMEALVKDAVENVFGKDADGVELAKGRFYLATDEISAHTMNYFRSLGAIMFQDLVDDTFKDLFGHLSVFDDWIGVVEQHICARATRFIGTMSSSFTSGIVNIRMKTGSSLERDLNYGYLLKSGGPVLTKEQEKQ